MGLQTEYSRLINDIGVIIFLFNELNELVYPLYLLLASGREFFLYAGFERFFLDIYGLVSVRLFSAWIQTVSGRGGLNATLLHLVFNLVEDTFDMLFEFGCGLSTFNGIYNVEEFSEPFSVASV